MAGYVVIRITERLGGGEPLRTAYAVAEPNQHRAIALFKLRPDHTADEQVEAVVELSQSAPASLLLAQQASLRSVQPDTLRGAKNRSGIHDPVHFACPTYAKA